MARCTRSGAQFSAYELDLLDDAGHLTTVDVFSARASLASHLHDAMLAAELRASSLDMADASAAEDDDGWEDEDPVDSRPPTPLTRPPSPLPPTRSSRSPSPLTDLPSSRSVSPVSHPPPGPCLPSPVPDSPAPCLPSLVPGSPSAPSTLPSTTVGSRPSYKRRQAKAHKLRRKRHRVAEAEAVIFGPAPERRHSQIQEEPLSTTFNAADLRTCAGSWSGPRPTKRARLARLREPPRHLRTLLDDDWDLVKWDGRSVIVVQFH